MGLSSAAISEYSSSKDPLFKISLAEWSLNKSIFGKSRQLGWEEWAKLLTDDPDALLQGDIKHLDFAKVAHQDFGIDAVEYVNTFFFEKANDNKYLSEIKKRVDDLGSKSLLIMCDNEGNLGDPDNKKRAQAIENHYKWTEAAKYLGCHSIRVNARSEGSWDDQIELAADGLRQIGRASCRERV